MRKIIAAWVLGLSSVSFAQLECKEEVTLRCPDNMVDACYVWNEWQSDQSLTTHHVCIRNQEVELFAFAEKCNDQLIYLSCPKGERNACDFPAVSAWQVCLQKQ